MTSAVAAAREQSFADFDKALAEVGRTMPVRALSQVVRRLALRGIRQIVRRTPVRFGQLRMNWQTTIGSPANGILSGLDPSGSQAISAAESVINSITGSGSYVPSVWFANNHPAAIVVEEGGYPPNPKKGTYIKERTTRSGRRVKAHYEIRSQGGFSKQAPRGMVAVTVQELLQVFDREDSSQ